MCKNLNPSGGTPVGGSEQFGLLSHGLDSMGDSPYPFF